MEAVEKIPKNFASIVETGPVEESSLQSSSLQTLQRVNANLHLAVSGSSFVQPLVQPTALPTSKEAVSKPAVSKPAVSNKSAGKPEHVGLGGKDGSFLSCLRVPGVSGYLIVC